jgi:hypothetical protein
METLNKKFDVIVLGETWRVDVFVYLDGYSVFKTEERINQNDGLVVYVSDSLNACVDQVQVGDVYGLTVDFKIGSKMFSLLTVYRSHDSSLECFTSHLKIFYENLKRNTSYLFIGDTNVNLMVGSDRVEKYLDVLYEAGFVSAISKPTREDGGSRSCIDHVFVNHSNWEQIRTAVVHTGITDHHSVYLDVARQSVEKHRNNTYYVSRQSLENNIRTLSWSTVTDEPDVNISADSFVSLIAAQVDKSIKQFNAQNAKHRRLKPWIDNTLVKAIRERDKLHKKVKRQPFNITLKEQFTVLRNNINILIRDSKAQYYRQKLNNSKDNPKLFWGTLNELAGRPVHSEVFPFERVAQYNSIPVTGENIKKDVANAFNLFFSTVGERLARLIDSSARNAIEDANFEVNTGFKFSTVSQGSLLKCIQTLRGGSAPGYDRIAASFVKDNANEFLEPLSHIVNRSLLSGVFPKAFGLAKVFPLYKSNDAGDIANYRPISLLSVFSKILEKVVKEQLVNYVEGNRIITERQFGFRRNKSINDALWQLTNNIDEALSGGDRCLVVFLDLAKAFDTVDRDKLLHKLSLIGVRDSELNWFRTYFTNRNQYVSVEGVESDPMTVNYGVIQGSTLGPILFLIYINNLTNLNIQGKFYLFADDTAVLFTGRDWETLIETASRDLSLIKKWFNQNALTLNMSKSKFIPFARSNRTDTDISILKIHSCRYPDSSSCDCDGLRRVNEYKYLGIILDSRLKWSNHVTYINNKIRKFIYIFYQLGHILNNKELKMLYYAYVQSIILHGILVWGGTLRSVLQPLIITQKAVLKAGLGRSRRYPTNLLFSEMDVLNPRQLFLKTIIVYLLKNKDNIFTPVGHNYPTRNAVSGGVNIPRLVNSTSRTCPSYIAHVLYRKIPNNIKMLDSTARNVSLIKKQTDRWLKELGREATELLLSSCYQ